MRFGIQTGQQHRSYAEIESLWLSAERHGYDSAWLYDHLIPVGGDMDGNVFEAWTLLASLMAKTERIRGGILVTCVMYRPMAVLAKMAVTVDHVSGGRLDFGIGSCWNSWEAALYHVDFPPLRDRTAKLIEAVGLARAMWSGTDEAGAPAHASPRPVQQPGPPVWIGGTGKRIPAVVAEHADGWNVVFTTFDEYAGHLARVKQACEEAGRDPATLKLSFGQRVVVDADEKKAEQRAREMYERNNAPFDDFVRDRVIFGTPEQVAEQVARFRDIGLDEFIAWHEPPMDVDADEQVATFAETVIPLLT